MSGNFKNKDVASSPVPVGSVAANIPMDVWRRALAQSRRLEESSSSSIALEECPYNRNHRVGACKFTGHLTKCRQNYMNEVAAKGAQVVNLPCKYNYTHQVIAPELLYHEARCDDRHDVPVYLRYFNFSFGEREGLEQTLDDCTFPQDELAKLREGCFIDQFIGSDNFTSKPTPLDDVRHPKAAKARLAKELELKEKAALAMRAQSSRLSPTVIQQHGGEGSSGLVTEEESEEWWNNNQGPKWDCMQALYQPWKPLSKCPAGLTKQQERDYAKWNTQWMAAIIAKENENQNNGE